MSSYKKYGDYAHAGNLGASSHLGASIGFALVGLAVGTAVALLFAPQSGDRLRSTLQSKSADVMENVRGKVMPFRRTAQTS